MNRLASARLAEHSRADGPDVSKPTKNRLPQTDIASKAPPCLSRMQDFEKNDTPRGLVPKFKEMWQGLRDSNPRPSVLETDALPTELNPYAEW